MRSHLLANNVAPSKLDECVRAELESLKKWGIETKKLKNMKFYDALAHLSSKFVKEEGKELGEIYTVVFFSPSVAKFCPRVLEMILPPLFNSRDPGFPYKCKVIFDEKSTYIDLVTIQDEVENIAKCNKNLKAVEFAYMPPDAKSKLQLSL